MVFIAFALTLFLLLAITIGIGFLKNIKWQNGASLTDPPLKTMLATCLIAGIIHACLSGVMIMPASQVAMVLIGGWSLALSENTLKLQQRAVAKFFGLFFTALLAASQFLFAISEIPYLPERTNYSANYVQMVPRFWQDGRVCEYNYNHSSTLE